MARTKLITQDPWAFQRKKERKNSQTNPDSNGGTTCAHFKIFPSKIQKNPVVMTGGSPALDMQFVSEDDEMLFIGIQMEDQL